MSKHPIQHLQFSKSDQEVEQVPELCLQCPLLLIRFHHLEVFLGHLLENKNVKSQQNITISWYKIKDNFYLHVFTIKTMFYNNAINYFLIEKL